MKYESSGTTNIYSLQYLLVVCKWNTRVRRHPHGLKVIDLVFFFIVFMFRGAPRIRFSDFSSFGTPRKRIFQIFRVSGHPESLFSGILRLRDSPTVHFHKKQLVGASRNIVFLNFYLSGCPEAQFFPFFRSSLASETLFLVIFDEKTRATGCFQRFSLIACKRNAVFGNFWWKNTSDGLFSAFFARRLQAKCCF